MTDDPQTTDDQTGPWVLALGTLAIGLGAIAVELLRRRRDDGDPRDPNAGGS